MMNVLNFSFAVFEPDNVATVDEIRSADKNTDVYDKLWNEDKPVYLPLKLIVCCGSCLLGGEFSRKGIGYFCDFVG